MEKAIFLTVTEYQGKSLAQFKQENGGTIQTGDDQTTGIDIKLPCGNQFIDTATFAKCVLPIVQGVDGKADDLKTARQLVATEKLQSVVELANGKKITMPVEDANSTALTDDLVSELSLDIKAMRDFAENGFFKEG